MLVIGPSLPVLRYLWSFSRSRQPLLRHWQFRSQKFATTPLPLSTWRYGAVHTCLYTALGHLGTTPATRVRIDTSWLCTSSPWTDAKSYRRVLSARHQ